MLFQKSPAPGRASSAADMLLPALQQEFASESAASLGASYRELMKALAALADLSAETAEKSGARLRDAALSDAAEALWCFVVQREACGFRNTEAVLREMNIPASVRSRMGIRRSP